MIQTIARAIYFDSRNTCFLLYSEEMAQSKTKKKLEWGTCREKRTNTQIRFGISFNKVSMEETVLVGICVILVRNILKCIQRPKPKKVWSRDWLLKRGQVNLLRELRLESEDWRNYLRMDVNTYEKLLNLVTPGIIFYLYLFRKLNLHGHHDITGIRKQDTVMRLAITPHERLSATLRYLATGNSLKDMEYATRISRVRLSVIIEETCEVILRVLKKKYFKVGK